MDSSAYSLGDGGGGLLDDLLHRDLLGNFLGDGGGGLLDGRLSIHGALLGRGLLIGGLHFGFKFVKVAFPRCPSTKRRLERWAQ